METSQQPQVEPKKPERKLLRVVVCGGRDYADRAHLEETMDILHGRFPIGEVIHGAARGADTMAGAWAKLNGIKETPVKADWDRYGKRAGFIRNSRMADMKPDVVIVFPGGTGTMMMKGIALNRGIEVVDHYLVI